MCERRAWVVGGGAAFALSLPREDASISVMPRIIVEANPAGGHKEVELPEGGPLLEAADERWLPIPFSCRSASCGTCQIEVLEGAELLEPAGEDEVDLLDVVGGPEGSRLACQVRVCAGGGVVRVKPV